MPLPSCDARALSLTIHVQQGKGRSGVVGNPVCYAALRLRRVQSWEPSMSETNASDGLWLGLDTGGTYTDAVLLADGRRVLASAKALTTPWDLSIGIGNPIRAVLERLPAGASRSDVSLTSVSTTLATNAVVENRFSPVCTLLIGFDDAMAERSGLQRPGSGGLLVRIRGGHIATGEE